MGFLTSLLGSENAFLTAAIALGVVLILIVLGVWLLKLIADASRAAANRNRSRRLGVVDSVPLDPRRQAILLRRDGVEHLIITGGPQDLVVETGIPVPQPTPRQPARGPDLRQPGGRAPEPARPQRRESSPAPARGRQPHSARQRETLRNTGMLHPVTASEPQAYEDDYPQLPADTLDNRLRATLDSPHAGRANDDGVPEAAGYETVDRGEGARDFEQGSERRSRDER